MRVMHGAILALLVSAAGLQDIDTLMRRLGSDDPAVRDAAIRALTERRAEGEEAVRGAVDHRDPEVATRARAIVARWERLDWMERVRRLATKWLMRQVENLEERVTSPNPAERLAVLREFAEWDAVFTPDPERRRMTRALGRLLPEFFTGNTSTDLLTILISLARRHHINVVAPQITALLRHEDAKIRRDAVRALDLLDARVPLDHVKRLLKDPDADVRRATLDAMPKTGDPEVVERVGHLLSDSEPEVRHEAISAFTYRVNAPDMHARILAMHDDPDRTIRFHVISYVERRTPEKGEEILIPLMEDADAWIREHATTAALDLGLSLNRELLERRIANETDERVQRHLKGHIDRLNSCDERARWLHLLLKQCSDQGNGLAAKISFQLVQAALRQAKADVVGLASDSDPRLRTKAVEAFDWIDRDAAVPVLKRLLDDPDDAVRVAAISKLGSLRVAETAPDLEKRIEGSWNDEDRWGAVTAMVEALGRMERAESAGLLRRALDHDSDAVSRAAAEALGRIKDYKSVDILIDRIARNKQPVAAARGLIHMGGDTVRRAVLKRFSEAEDGLPIVWIMVLKSINFDPTPKEIISLLDSGSPESRMHAITLIDWIQDSDGVRELKRRLRAGELEGEVLAYVLAKIRDWDARDAADGVRPLLDHPKHRLQALDVLARLRDRKAIPAIRKFLGEEDWRLRKSAIEALGLLGDVESAATILKHVDDDEPQVQEQVALALGRLKHAPAVPKLIPLLEDPDEQLRRSVLHALAMIGDGRAAEAMVRVLPEDRWPVAEALLSLPRTEVFEAVMSHLKVSPRVGGDWALTILVGLSAPEASGVVRSMLAEDYSRYHSTAALTAGLLEMKDSASRLEELLRSPNRGIRRSAAEGLVRLGHPEAYAKLRPGDVNLSTVRRAARLGVPEAREDLKRMVSRVSYDRMEGALELARLGSRFGLILMASDPDLKTPDYRLLGIEKPELLQRISSATVRRGIYDGTLLEVIEKLSRSSKVPVTLDPASKRFANWQVVFSVTHTPATLERALKKLVEAFSPVGAIDSIAVIERDGTLLLTQLHRSTRHWRARLNKLLEEGK